MIETGAGALEKYNEKLIDIWHLETNDVDDVIGLDEMDIDYVIMTHLHFDHAGGSTVKRDDEYRPLFKRAIHFIHEIEWKSALTPHELSRYSYFERDFVPLQKSNVLKFVEKDREKILPEIEYIWTGGHSEGHSIVKVTSENETLIFPGDLILTHYNVPISWISGIDLCRLENYNARVKLYEEAVKYNYMFTFPHEPEPIIGRIKMDEKGRYLFERW